MSPQLARAEKSAGKAAAAETATVDMNEPSSYHSVRKQGRTRPSDMEHEAEET